MRDQALNVVTMSHLAGLPKIFEVAGRRQLSDGPTASLSG